MKKEKMIFNIDNQNDDFENMEVIEIEGEVEFEREDDYLIIRKKCLLN